MSFVRRKTVKGKVYLYEVESYRDPATGKVRQRVKQYIGRERRGGEGERGSKGEKKLGTTSEGCCCQVPPLKLGDKVKIRLMLDGEWRDLPGVIVVGMTQVPACAWPKHGRVKHEVVFCPYDPPGAVTVQYEWADQVRVVTMPRREVRRW